MHQLTPSQSAAARVLLSAFTLLACSVPGRGQAATDTWLGATGNWSVAADWASGTAPPTGGGTGRILELPFNGSGYSATNNLGTPFQLNGLQFDGGNGSTVSTIILANAAGNSLQFAGANPFILQNTGVAVNISAASSLSAATSIGGAGFGTLTFSGVLSGGVAAGNDVLTIDGTGVLPAVAGVPGGSLVTFSGPNTFTGNIELGNANLALGNNTALGAAANPLIVNAANNSLRFSAPGLTIANPVTVNGTLTFAGTNAGALAGPVGGAGGMTIAGSGMLTLTAASAMTGVTTVGVPGAVPGTGGGGLTLSGAGSLASTSSILLGGGDTLAIVNAAAANSTDRINDAAPLTFQNGRLSFTAAPATNTASGETFGPVTVQGGGTITVTAATQSGSSSVLQFGALARVANGTLFIQNTTSAAQAVGGGAPGPSRTDIFFSGGLPTLADPAGASGGLNTAIVPFVSGSVSGTATNVMGTVATYEANGVRLLSPTDTTVFAQAFSALVPHANNNLYGNSVGLSSPTTVTSLVATGTNGVNISGTGTVTVATGTVVAGAAMAFSGPTLDFGTATGYIHLGNTLTISGASLITGSGGIVVSSANGSALYLSPATAPSNPFTGGLYLNGNPVVYFGLDGNLGAAGQPVTLDGGTLSYLSQVTGGIAANRPIILGPGGGALGTNNIGALTVPASISGPGGLTVTGTTTLSGANSYTGPTMLGGTVTLAGSNSGGGLTIVQQGTVNFTNASNFSTGAILLNGGTLNALAGGTFNRDIDASMTSCVFSVSPGQTVTYAGTLSGGGTVSVGGGGAFVLNTVSPTTGGLRAGGTLTTGGGTVVMTGPATIQHGGITADAGGLFRLDYTGGVVDRLGPYSSISVVSGGELQMDGAAVATNESFGTLTANGTITIVPGSGVQASLSAARLTVSTSSLPALFRGTNLGGPDAESAHVNVANMAVGTVILNALADTSATGTGQDQAVYGTAGIRPAVAGDFTSGAILQNAVPTNTPIAADFRVSGTVSTVDTPNTIRSLRLEAGGTLNLAPGTLNISGGFVYSALGGASSITGTGSLQNITVLANGDLNISATIGAGNLTKVGPGTLTLSGATNFTNVTVSGGALALSNGQVTSISGLTVSTGLVLATAATGLRVTGNLIESPTNVISGPGTLTFDPPSATAFFLYGANTYSGGTIGGPNATFLVMHPLAAGAGPVTLATTNGTANPMTLLSLDFGAGTFANDINLPTTNSYSEIDTSAAPGVVTLSGRIRGGNAASGTAVQFNSFSGSSGPGNELTNPNNDFTATVAVTTSLGITCNAALGNPANAIQLSGTLRFDADGIVVPRSITAGSSSSFGATFDTGSNRAEVSGAISGSGAVTKVGTGTLTLSGSNTFGGDLFVDGGAVYLSGSLSTPGSNYGVFLAGGSTFGGNASINRSIIGGSATIAPGTPTATGRLTVGGFLEVSGTTFQFRIDGSSPGDGTSLAGFDQIVSTYTGPAGLNLSGAVLILDATVGNGFDPTINDAPIFIIDNQSSTPVEGGFQNAANGALVNLGGFTAHISYFGDTATNSITGGNDVVLYNFQAVPEPSSFLLAGAAMMGVAGWRRRRQRNSPV